MRIIHSNKSHVLDHRVFYYLFIYNLFVRQLSEHTSY